MVRKVALVVVDLQEDFLPSEGSLAIKGGRDVVPIICNLLKDEKYQWSAVVATQDWHPKDHISFASQHNVPPFTELKFQNPVDEDGEAKSQIVWPDHCIQNTFGSSLDPSFSGVFNSLKPTITSAVVRKGYLRDREYYSCFQDSWKLHHTEMESLLRNEEITDVVFVGLAYDFCVLHSAIDGAAAGFRSYVIKSCCKSVNSEDDYSTDDKYKAGDVILVENENELVDHLKIFD